ncbi:GGDEF domain-containing protein [Candidatus Methylospira mobilis]|uniref:diguanylate cyclase n=1 Tax=Candidatus Methylospira mobilis TaxID=1808979 RepID=A0A5Q0BKS8_9GAMM|nr:GGDEF domain-containing protein [Candidatus Methylospira mobilis]QFY44390.1 GGDEF domain-containing protein [Candidatus Methylospira mobilis]WNV06174.1 GGDEF domain-containing protein [Candidatus Methylospira mobilis]
MRYQESVEESVTFVKQIMPLMAKHSAPMNPISFAVWYEYISGVNPRLKTAMDLALTEKTVLDGDTMEALYRRFIVVLNEDVMAQLPLELQRLMANASQSVAITEQEVEHYSHSLQQFSEKLSSEAAPTGSDSENAPGSFSGRIYNMFNTPQATSDSTVAQMLQETQQLKQSTSSLVERLLENCKEIEALRAEVMRVRQDSLEDSLTGLANRRGFDEALASLLSESSAGAFNCCLVMADIDHFKKINDTYGHLFGDKVIQAVAELLKRNVSDEDVPARYGGEEFAVLLPKISPEGARALAEAVRVAVASCRIRREDSNEQIGNFTISLGVARYIRGESSTDFLNRADKALYTSKSQGRNRVTVYGHNP